jgi:hypothetical protein
MAMARWSVATATAIYVLASVAMSWPLLPQIASAPAGDMGDPLFNAWVLAWGSDHVAAMLAGDAGAYARWWNANIFHPAPLALGYSEHLAPQVVMGLPLWWATGNVLLVYNTLYLATSVLSGLGMFLLVRELTGRPRAALVAGLFFAFVPYRIAQLPHLQVLSSQWMPFVLYAFRRYLEHGRAYALAGAVVALAAQQLSCGYYLLYFSPFVALYLIWEISARRRWHDWRLHAALAFAVLADLALTWPLLSPYFELRALGFLPRPLEEVSRYSADVYAYVTAHETNRVWGAWLQSVRRAENELFPGLLPVLAAALGAGALASRRWRATAALRAPGRSRRVSLLFAAMAVAGAAGVLTFIVTGGVNLKIADMPIVRIRGIGRPLALLAAGLCGVLLVSRRARAFCAWGTDLRVGAFVLLVLAVVLSWGPDPRADSASLGFQGPYQWLYDYVSGFDGLRVPARMAMVSYLFLSVMAGYGLASLDRLRHAPALMAAIGAVFLLEATGAPVAVGRTDGEEGVATPPAEVHPAASAPAVYAFLATLPHGTVVAELPFGFTTWELRYVYYSAVHRQRLLNGYSGGFPAVFLRHVAALNRPLTRPDLAWLTLTGAGATHVVLHRDAFLAGEDAPVASWLRGRGARLLRSFGRDELYELPR